MHHRYLVGVPMVQVETLGAGGGSICHVAGGEVHVVTAMSVETLLNLLRLLPGDCHAVLARTPLVTPATRVINEATKRFPGIPVTLANGPQAGDMVEAIIACTQPGNPDE